MNIIFGIWRPQGPPVTAKELERIALHTQRFAPDGQWFRIGSEIGLGVQAQYTHARSRLELQPAADEAGNFLVYDGRLDNYRDLIRDLALSSEDAPDSKIVLCAFRRWGDKCFERFIGDWALALWNPQAHTLYLARDHAGTRTLHYARDAAGTVMWATFLDSYKSTSLLDALDPVYIASYLAMVPCYTRSPYRDVRTVLPGSFLKTTTKGIFSAQFWTPTAHEQIPSRSAEDYEAQFLHLLKQSVARRTVSGTPILAQLSGGMDSTSIVCTADLLRNSHELNTEPLDTLSYFDDSEPDWNERPYFTLVEEMRGRRGFHVDISRYRSTFERPSQNGATYLYPGIDESTVRQDVDLLDITSGRGYRSILSGIGGDEFTGGNPNSAIDIAEMFVTGMISSGLRQAVAWCLARRISIFELLGQSASFVRSHMNPSHHDSMVAAIPWLRDMARECAQAAIRELPLVFCIPFHARPKMVDVSETWWYTLRTQPHLKPSEVFRYEYRYPYFDRDFLEFLLRLPPEQLSQPGRRRFLMRRSMRGIVPQGIIERRRKAFSLSAPLHHLRESAPHLTKLIENSILAERGYVDTMAIQRALDDTVRGADLRWWGLLSRFAGLEAWLQHREQSADACKALQNPVCTAAHTDNVPVA
jgi:asparagine synthase (glutamine-hydrolysing)